MNTTSITIIAVFVGGILVAALVGRLFRFDLKDSDFPHLDGMRAAAALLVVCSHYLSHAGLIMTEPSNTPLRDAFGAVGVQIFFSITGFLFMRKALEGPVDVAKLIKSRVHRIVPLYLVAMTAAIAVAIHIISAAHQATPVLLIDLVRAYGYGLFATPVPSVAGMSIAGQAGQMWTLAWEWRFYALVPVIGALAARRAWGTAALVIAVGFAVIDQVNGMLPPWLFFIPGMLCAVVEKRVRVGGRAQIALTAIGALAFVLALALTLPVNGAGQTALCALGFPCLLFGYRKPLALQPLRLLGEVSYSIYMLHLVVASLFWSYVQSDTNWMFYQTPAERLPVAVIALGGLFVLSFMSYALIERPFMPRTKQQPVSPAVVSTSAIDGGATSST